jgi:uncharacterized metal-binding protein YceD (DUF177 family)
VCQSEGCALVIKCANNWCFALCRDEGKMFRLDIELGSNTGDDEIKTEYLWLCARCAQKMHPKVEVTGNIVTLRLTKNNPEEEGTHEEDDDEESYSA